MGLPTWDEIRSVPAIELTLFERLRHDGLDYVVTAIETNIDNSTDEYSATVTLIEVATMKRKQREMDDLVRRLEGWSE